MISKSTLLHLRLPFSYFLLPTYLLAVSCADKPVWWKSLLIFFILHFLLYPASNAYNSYYDHDTDSIGTLKHPPPIEKELLPVSLSMDIIAIVFGLIIGWIFAAGVLIYGLASKAYSYDKIRLKKRPVISLLGVGLMQGAFTFLIAYYGIQDITVSELFNTRVLFAAAISSFFLSAAYPLTQIYQHKSDRGRGDVSFSMLLGIRGTFIFCASFLALAMTGFSFYFMQFYGVYYTACLSIFLLPVGIFFFYWLIITFQDESNADYENTMRLNVLSSTALNLCFLLFIIKNHLTF